MKITVKQDDSFEQTEISITCPRIDDRLSEIISYLSLIDNTVAGMANGETHFIEAADIYYFEAVENRVFIYTESRCYETSSKLYMLEDKFKNARFARISKSVIANLRKIKSIKPEKNRKLCATLLNGEKLLVSRQYIDEIKERLGV